MKQFLVFMLFISVIFIPQSVFSETATTIDELAVMYNIKPCVDCHEEIHDEWKSSWHGKSIVDPRVLRTWRTFIKRGLDKEETLARKDLKDTCLPCHLPQIKDASYDVGKQISDLIVIAVDEKDKAKRDAAKKELSRLNINCLGCHNLKGLDPSLGNPRAGAIYGPKGTEDPEDLPHEEFETIKSDFIKTSEFCAQCHHGCPKGMPSSVCSSLYTGYIEGYVVRGGTETCQDCHMRETEEEYKSHKFPGIYEEDFVKEGVALTLDVRTTNYLYHLEDRVVPAIVLKIDLTNKAGHDIPHG